MTEQDDHAAASLRREYERSSALAREHSKAAAKATELDNDETGRAAN
jgi:hypothetical protein